MSELTHFDRQGRARMIDVGNKADTIREAVAEGRVKIKANTLDLIREGQIKKGDVLNVAQVAGIMSVKQTSTLIPMCHPLMITGVDLNIELNDEKLAVEIIASVRTTGKTGVEMEALTAVSTAALTVYDMCKSADKEMVIEDIKLTRKTGGKSGTYQREE